MAEKYELKDEELDKVTGGGSGTIPQGGITYNGYSVLEPEHYYSQDQNLDEVVYVYKASGMLYYTREAFSVDLANNTWISRNRTPSGVRNPIENVEGFMSRYIYQLNVKIGV